MLRHRGHWSQEAQKNEIRAGRTRLARKAVRTAQMKVNTGSYDPLGTLSTLKYSIVQLKNFRMEKAVTYPMRKDLSLVRCEELEPILLDGDMPQ